MNMKKLARALLLGATLSVVATGLARADGGGAAVPPGFPFGIGIGFVSSSVSPFPGFSFGFGNGGNAFNVNDLLGGLFGGFSSSPVLANPLTALPGLPSTPSMSSPSFNDLFGGLGTSIVADPALLDPATVFGGTGNALASAPVQNNFGSLLGLFNGTWFLGTPTQESVGGTLGGLFNGTGSTPSQSLGGLLDSSGNLPSTPSQSLGGLLDSSGNLPSTPSQSLGGLLDSSGNGLLGTSDQQSLGGLLDGNGQLSSLPFGTSIDSNKMPIDPGQGATSLDPTTLDPSTDLSSTLDDTQGTTDFLQGIMDSGSFGDDSGFGGFDDSDFGGF
jgi:hypothetical protein